MLSGCSVDARWMLGGCSVDASGCFGGEVAQQWVTDLWPWIVNDIHCEGSLQDSEFIPLWTLDGDS